MTTDMKKAFAYNALLAEAQLPDAKKVDFLDLGKLQYLLESNAPESVINSFWATFGADLPLSNLNEKDVKIINAYIKFLHSYYQTIVLQFRRIHEIFGTPETEERFVKAYEQFMNYVALLAVFIRSKRAMHGFTAKLLFETQKYVTMAVEEPASEKKGILSKLFGR